MHIQRSSNSALSLLLASQEGTLVSHTDRTGSLHQAHLCPTSDLATREALLPTLHNLQRPSHTSHPVFLAVRHCRRSSPHIADLSIAVRPSQRPPDRPTSSPESPILK